MMIQQHDGVMVDAAELRQGFAKQLREEEEVLQGGGRRQGLWVRPPLPPLPLYRRMRGGRAQPCPFLQGRGAAKRGGGVHPPQGTSEVPSPLWTLPSPSLLGAWASWGWCPWPI